MMSQLNHTSTRRYWHRLFEEEPRIPIPPAFFRGEPDCGGDRGPSQAMFKRFVCTVNIETSTYCNRRCTYCPVAYDDSRKLQVHMDDATFRNVIDQLDIICFSSTICFNLYNEPLADDHMFSVLPYARRKLPSAFFMLNSNGDYVTPERLDQLRQSGLSGIFVTLHPGPKKKYDAEDRRKCMSAFLRRLGLKRAEVRDGELSGSLEATVDWSGMRLTVMTNDWAVHGSSRSGEIESLEAAYARSTPCVRPMREFTISSNGDVYPCCQFYPEATATRPHIIGNVTDSSIFEIYASDSLAKWRRMLFPYGEKEPPCRTCRDTDYSEESTKELRKKILARVLGKAEPPHD